MVSNLPAEFDDARTKKVVAFIEEKDKDLIEKLKKEIDSLSAEFEVLKVAKKASSDTKASKPKKKEASKKAKNVISSKDEKRSRSKTNTKEAPFDAE